MSVSSRTPGPLFCAPLLRVVDSKLIELLRSLSRDEWDLQTIVPSWRVRDVAAHLLDTVLRKLSLVRDGSVVDAVEIRSQKDLLDFVNRLNREGVTVYRRLSPPVLIDLMEIACHQSAAFHESLDPFARATFSVSWAGESESLNWFDTARELTERWHHQEQIRLATNRSSLMVPDLYHPVLDCFLRGLPFAFHEVPAADGSHVIVHIEGNCGGFWHLVRERGQWMLRTESPDEVTARVVIPQQIAWRIFTKGMDRYTARKMVVLEGDQELGATVLGLTAIVG